MEVYHRRPPLQEHSVVGKPRGRLPSARLQSPLEVLGRRHQPHPLSPAAHDGLYHEREPHSPGLLLQDGVALVLAVVARAHGHAGIRHDRLGHALRPHGVDGLGRGAHERYAGSGALPGEPGVLGEEAVPRVQRLFVPTAGRRNTRGCMRE